jgi:hypothetical protein
MLSSLNAGTLGWGIAGSRAKKNATDQQSSVAAISSFFKL